MNVVENKLQVGFRLIHADLSHSLGISRNVVFDSNSDLSYVLKAVASFHIAIFTCANIEQLREQLPHVLRDGPVFVTVVNDHYDTFNAFFDRVKAIGSQWV